ncbi:cell division protein SepF [Spiroplasma endosymbiont of Polydrusus formosus]|uniref:cell division protein SepF n=1 Tax=Spiroplasma endosymbiont of Polydrusus formosus TaxID=3139326 RepID=UPI0035B53334
MSIFKKKQRNIYDSQPRIDFNNSPTEPIVHGDHNNPKPQPIPIITALLQKANFDREAINEQQTDAIANSVITTGFVADSYRDAPKMADLLLANGQLIVHLEKLPKAERIRLLYFISGVMYAFDGYVQKIEYHTYHFIVRKND